MLYRPPLRLVSVRVPFLVLVLSGACSISAAWRLRCGALTTPYYQTQILECVEDWNNKVARVVRRMRKLAALYLAPWLGQDRKN
jgi:hypothetical protein